MGLALRIAFSLPSSTAEIRWAICLLRTPWRRWVADRCILMNGCDVRNFRVLVFNSSILALLVLLIHAAFSNASASPPVASTAPPDFFCCCCGAMAGWMAAWRIGGWLCPAGGWWMVVGFRQCLGVSCHIEVRSKTAHAIFSLGLVRKETLTVVVRGFACG